ncbi:autotransporter outer membrane beta-barrel domain-containing protein, partial [Serratia marcescens]|uniref:autotransporter outer membrane beta-barrel domain-containing protein n=1 Tax=Serratia marcescens TaxID=615 RepID=UPI0028141A0C
IINGNYTGNAGVLALQTALGNDSSASDRLIVNQGVINGTTAIQITNLGGIGAATTADGIRVVDAQNGATSAS